MVILTDNKQRRLQLQVALCGAHHPYQYRSEFEHIGEQYQPDPDIEHHRQPCYRSAECFCSSSGLECGPAALLSRDYPQCSAVRCSVRICARNRGVHWEVHCLHAGRGGEVAQLHRSAVRHQLIGLIRCVRVIYHSDILIKFFIFYFLLLLCSSDITLFPTLSPSYRPIASSSSSSSKSLSSGAIAGIVIGVVAFCVIVVAGMYYFFLVPRSKPSSIYSVSADSVEISEIYNKKVLGLIVRGENEMQEV